MKYCRRMILLYYILWENTKHGVFVWAAGCSYENMKSIESGSSKFQVNFLARKTDKNKTVGTADPV